MVKVKEIRKNGEIVFEVPVDFTMHVSNPGSMNMSFTSDVLEEINKAYMELIEQGKV
jgi:hypothetical protein